MTNETRMAVESVTANSRNNRPTMPPMSRIGVNTATNETLIERTVNPTSRAPWSAACIGRTPCSIWRVTFSITTIASSTTNPVEMASAIKERLSRL